MRPDRLNPAALAIVLLVAVALGVLFAREDKASHNEALAVAETTFGEVSTDEIPHISIQPTATNIPIATSTPQPAVTATVVQATALPAASQESVTHVHPTAASLPDTQSPSAPEPVPQPDRTFAATVLALVNAERVGRGLPSLEANGTLAQGAAAYAQTLLQLNTLSHNADGGLLARIQATGYGEWALLGEVLWASTGYLPPERTVADWLASSGHRDIVLNPTFTKAGIGCSVSEGDPLRARCVMYLAG